MPCCRSKGWLECWFSHLLVAIHMLAVAASSCAQPPLDEYGNSAHFDYKLTRTYLVYDKQNNVMNLGNPFQPVARGTGVSVYAILLKYADRFEPLVFPVDEPDYRIVLLGSGQIRNMYVGDYWLGFEDKITFLNDEDYAELSRLLYNRFLNKTPATAEQAQKRINKRLLKEPKSRLEEFESLAKARRKLDKRLERDRGDDYWSNLLPDKTPELKQEFFQEGDGQDNTFNSPLSPGANVSPEEGIAGDKAGEWREKNVQDNAATQDSTAGKVSQPLTKRNDAFVEGAGQLGTNTLNQHGSGHSPRTETSVSAQSTMTSTSIQKSAIKSPYLWVVVLMLSIALITGWLAVRR